jgi:hypothetical protein
MAGLQSLADTLHILTLMPLIHTLVSRSLPGHALDKAVEGLFYLVLFLRGIGLILSQGVVPFFLFLAACTLMKTNVSSTVSALSTTRDLVSMVVLPESTSSFLWTVHSRVLPILKQP